MRWFVVLTLATGCRAILGIDEPVGDIAGDGDTKVDGMDCYGSGLFTLCPETAPVALTFAANTIIDTSVAASCDLIASPDYCVIVASSLTIPFGITVRGIGARSLVFVASEEIQIQGILTVSSQRNSFIGAGASAASCGNATAPENDIGGGGGGAGGSFGGRGGNGGVGDTNDSAGGDGTAAAGVSALQIAPTTARAGCPGSRGGDGSAPSTGGGFGNGGGATYLVAGRSITISGNVTANGAGASGGQPQSGGGGGGGSGGFIGFDAPIVTATGVIAANGGGGAEGAGSALAGAAGSDGGANAIPAMGGSGGAVDGGEGGQGSGGATISGGLAVSDSAGAGGGGGGAGYIYVKAGTAMLSGTTSPAPSIQ